MSGHTPGPWHIGIDAAHAGNRRIACVGRPHIAKVYASDASSDPVCDANARLIAAAPVLLSIAERWAAIDGGAWHPERYMASLRELKADTAAAIAKATGASA